MKTTLLLISTLALSGCEPKQTRESDPATFINLSVPPVTLYAADPATGSIMLQDGTGYVSTFRGDYYAARAIASSKKPGDVLKP